MRSVQEEALINFYQTLRKRSTYNRKWWNPLEFSIYVHDLVRSDDLYHVVEVGTGNGVTATWAALSGATVYTCDIEVRPKVWEEETFPLPHLISRIQFSKEFGHEFLFSPTKDPCLVVLDGPTGEKSFRKVWSALQQSAKPGDIIVAPIGHPEIYQAWLKIAKAGFKVVFDSSREAYTTRWPSDGSIRDW